MVGVRWNDKQESDNDDRGRMAGVQRLERKTTLQGGRSNYERVSQEACRWLDVKVDR